MDPACSMAMKRERAVSKPSAWYHSGFRPPYLALKASTNFFASGFLSASDGLHQTALMTYSTFFLPNASAACFSLPRAP